MPNKTILVAFTVVASALAASAVHAADHHVSTSGSASWAQCTNMDTPCSAKTALANAQAGDTVLFRGGTYNVGTSTGNTPSIPDWNPSRSGTSGNPITFKNYPGETPIVNAPATVLGNGCLADIAFGVVNQDYIVWDGFTAIGGNWTQQGQVYLFGTNHVTLKNLILDGGSRVQTTDDNCNLLRIDESAYFTVQNCLFRNFRHQTNYHDTGALKTYHNSARYGHPGENLVEYCEFHTGSTAVFIKSSTDDLTFRNNFIHDVNEGVLVTPALDVMQSDRGKVYNNLIVNVTGGGFGLTSDGDNFHGDDWEFYNNTVYNTGYDVAFTANQAGHGSKIYNNIITPATFTTRPYATIAEADHNQWGTGPKSFLIHQYAADRRSYSTLAAWQASTELEGGGHPGVGDLESNPGFSNGSGTLRLKTDFALGAASPCRGKGRNGVDMGANVAALGYSDTGRVGAPTAPTGVKIIRVP